MGRGHRAEGQDGVSDTQPCPGMLSMGVYSHLFIPLQLHIKTPKLNALNISTHPGVQHGCLGLLQYMLSLI